MAANGGVLDVGTGRLRGSRANQHLNEGEVRVTAPNGSRSWLVVSNRGVHVIGGAAFLGSAASLLPSGPVVGIAEA